MGRRYGRRDYASTSGSREDAKIAKNLLSSSRLRVRHRTTLLRSPSHPLDLRYELIACAVTFLHVRGYLRLQLAAVVGGDHSGGQDENGDSGGGWIVFQQTGYLEAAHPGHHQVQDDHVGQVLFRGGESGLAAVGALDRVAEAGQFFVEQLVERHVVIDQEQAGLRLVGHGELADAVEQAIAIDRLYEIVVGAECDAKVALVDTRDDYDREVARHGMALQCLQHLPAVEAGKDQVECHRYERRLAGQTKSLLAVACADRLISGGGERGRDQRVRLCVVLNHQHPLRARLSRLELGNPAHDRG